MNRWESWLSHLSTIIVTATGTIYFWMEYFMKTDDPFALVNHPWQPAMMSLHVIVAPVLTFVLGLTVNSHVRKKLASRIRSNRISGLAALVTFPGMVVSGYLLQVSTSDLLSKVSLVTHLITSAVFALTYIVHQVVSIRMARAAGVPSKRASLARQQTA